MKYNDILNVNGVLETNTTTYIVNQGAKEVADVKGILDQMRRLHLHGVTTPYLSKLKSIRQVEYYRIYYIPVFQQEILSIYRQTRANNNNNWINASIGKKDKKVFLKKISRFQSKTEEKKVKEMVIRSVYALNLDYGLVKVGITTRMKPFILFVNPFPINDEIKQLFESASEDFMRRWDSFSHTEVILGTDPEFVLQDSTGKMVLASKFLPKYGKAGCDRIWTNKDRTQLPLAELRPTPSSDPRELTINLYNSMLLASKRITDRTVKWLAGGLPIDGFPIGGHIHFSNIWPNTPLLRALDNYLTLPLILLEDTKGARRRPKYGFLGDYRDQFHGGFEYRTPPSWLVTPTVTKGVIALAKIIAENYRFLYQNPLSDYTVQEAYYRGDKNSLRPVVNKLWRELKQLNDYSLYEQYLTPFEALINKEYTWNEKADIRIAWRLTPYNRKKKS